ncbi:hypothetical protein [Lactobacillus sp. PSON]|uniref:hypothetical protein n=1 Tax=Lactobacillus sp. PSON TaxID=3455454 RepID=UPI004041F850
MTSIKNYTINDVVQYLNFIGIKVPVSLKKYLHNTAKKEIYVRSHMSINLQNFYCHNFQVTNSMIRYANIDYLENILSWIKKYAKNCLQSYKYSNLSVKINLIKKVNLDLKLTDYLDMILQGIPNFRKKFYKMKKKGFIDLEKYYGKPNEGFSIYISELDSTFISLSFSDDLTVDNLVDLAHELGHAFYNESFKPQYFNLPNIVKSEQYAYENEIRIIKKIDMKSSLKESYCLNYLLQLFLYSAYLSFMLKLMRVQNDIEYVEVVKLFVECFEDYVPLKRKLSSSNIENDLIDSIENNKFDEFNFYYVMARFQVLQNNYAFFKKYVSNL